MRYIRHVEGTKMNLADFAQLLRDNPYHTVVVYSLVSIVLGILLGLAVAKATGKSIKRDKRHTSKLS